MAHGLPDVLVGLAGEAEDEVPLHADAVFDKAAGDAFGHLGVDALVHGAQDAVASRFDSEGHFTEPVVDEQFEFGVAEPVQNVDASGGVPHVPFADAVPREGRHLRGDDAGDSEEEVVHEPERGHAVLGVQHVELADDVLGLANSDRDVGVGADGRTAEGAVVGAASGADDVGFQVPGTGCPRQELGTTTRREAALSFGGRGPVRVLRQKRAVDVGQGVDVGAEHVSTRLTGRNPRRTCPEEAVTPQDPGQFTPPLFVVQEGGDPQFTLAEDERPQVGHARVGENTVRHGFGMVTTDHERDVRGETGRDTG